MEICALLLNGVLELARKYLNSHIALNKPGRNPFCMAEMYKWVSILLFLAFSDITFDKAVEELSLSDFKVRNKEIMLFISNPFPEYAARQRGLESGDTWSIQLYATTGLERFERETYECTRTFCLSAQRMFVTLNDDFNGTPASVSEDKLISSRKADKQGNSADAICDARFQWR